MTSHSERQVLLFIEMAGISLISLVSYNIGLNIQGQPLGALLFFCPSALYVWMVRR